MTHPRGKPGWFGKATRGLMRACGRLFFRLVHRWRVENPPKLDGGYVIVANHESYLDPIVLGACNPQSVAFLMNSVSYRNPLICWFYRWFRAIPVSPSGVNRQVLREAHAALDAGEVVGVFPEGGISRDGGPLLGNPGAVALVLKKNVSVVPVGLTGIREVLPYGGSFPRFGRRIVVRYGDPIPAAELMQGADRKERLARATERIMSEIARLTGRRSREEELRAQKA